MHLNSLKHFGGKGGEAHYYKKRTKVSERGDIYSRQFNVRESFIATVWLTRPWANCYLLDCGEDHVPTAGGGQPVETSADAVDCDDVEVLASGVVSTVHDGPHGTGKGDAEFGSRRSSTTSLRHPGLSEMSAELKTCRNYGGLNDMSGGSEWLRIEQ